MEYLGALKSILYTTPLSVTSAFLVLVLGTLYIVIRNRNLPPGPWGLPYLGYWPFLNTYQTHQQLRQLMKKYGDVYSLTITGKLMIHIGTIKDVKEALITKADYFAMRNTSFNVFSLLFPDGVATLNGESWRVVRKFFVQGFREFGLTSLKDYMTGPVYDAMNITVKKMRAEDGKSLKLEPILSTQSSFILRRMLFNDGGISEKELSDVTENYGKAMIHFFVGNRGLLSGELVKRVIYPMTPGYKTALESYDIAIDILQKVVKRHEDTFDEDNARDFIDIYIKERNDRRRKNDPTAEYFTERTLVYSLIQFIGDGISSIALFIGLFLYAAVQHPEEQEKVYKELVEVVGTDRQPTMEDKNKLTYTNAFIYEVIRTNEFITVMPSVECTKETTIGGYRVPVGSLALLNFWAFNRDPNMFEDPDVFRPSRYIPSPGKPKPELPIMFGLGKRACAGEFFTMMQIFLFVTTILKNFRLSRPENFSSKNVFDGSMEVIVHEREPLS